MHAYLLHTINVNIHNYIKIMLHYNIHVVIRIMQWCHQTFNTNHLALVGQNLNE